MTARAELFRLVDQLDETEVPEALDYLKGLASDGQSVTDLVRDEDLDDDASERGEYAKLGRPTSKHDPLWGIVGLGRTTEPTDIRNKDEEDEQRAQAILGQ